MDIRQLKILQLGKFYPIMGGVEKVMRDITEGLSERGIFCDMLCAKLSKDGIEQKDKDKVRTDGQNTFIQLNNCGRIIFANAVTKKAGTMLSWVMVRYLRKNCGKYDIIHVHHPDPMAALALYLSGYKGRVILHWHSDIVSQKNMLRFYKPLQNWLTRRAETIVGTTPVYVAGSPHLKKVQDKCTYVPIGIRPIPSDEGRAQSLRSQFNFKYLILSVGRLVTYKGYAYLVDAMSFLPEDYGLCIVGNGPLRADLERLIKEKSLENRVCLAGYVETGQLFYDYFASCDIFVLPSIMKTEAFGIVQIEAMSCGKPVVTTRIPESGVSWVNKDGVSGVNVPVRDAAALAEGIKMVCERKEVYGKGARELFETRYTIEAMIDKTIEVYEKQKSL